MLGLKTISEYNKEIKRIDKILYDFKEYIEECPEDSGTKANYESLKYIRNELKKERDKLEDYTHKRNDKLSMNRAKSELELVTKIVDEVKKI